jgi:hypothetical protein
LGQLPESVPRHFNAAGAPDRWGNKAGMWTLPILGLLLYGGLSVLSRFARFYNVPFPVDRTSPDVLGLLRRFVIALKTGMLLTFAYISWAAIRTALGEANGLGRGFLPCILIGTMMVPAWFLSKLRRYRLA